MSVDKARRNYGWYALKAGMDACGRCAPCVACCRLWNDVEAASIVYDLAVAEASIERLRRSVAWA